MAGPPALRWWCLNYRTASAFRDAVLAHAKADATAGSSDMDALLKIGASGRFLTRLMPEDPSWTLKGGLNLLARLGDGARLTRDADVATARGRATVEELVFAAADRDIGDYFTFRVRPPQSLPTDGDDGGLRFAVDALVAGKILTSFKLDVVLVAPAPDDVERLALPNPLAFAGLVAVVVSALRPGRQAIEKLHAFTRDHGVEENSRPRDLVDMLALAVVTPFDPAELRSVGAAVFAERHRQSWPPLLKAPPTTWGPYWDLEGRGRHGLPEVDLAGAFDRFVRFWTPVLDGSADHPWIPMEWRWG